MSDGIFAEAIVIGSGPAGMGTALGLAREGIKVVILEKQDSIGAIRRGETIRFDKEMDSLLGTGFLDRQTLKKITLRSYFSHTGLNKADRKISNPNLIISWPDFMRAMANVLLHEGVDINLSSVVSGFTEEKGRITGVMATVNKSAVEELHAQAVFSCGGHEDPASRYLKMKRAGIDYPVFKQLVINYTGPDDRLEYYFHIKDGILAIAAIFPRGNSSAEIVLVDYKAKSLYPQISIDQFCREHNGFADRIAGTSSYYSLNTYIPMGGMLRPCSPKPGLVMAGDALGHVQARGGSGIRSSFLIGYTAGKISAGHVKSGRWSIDTSREINKNLDKSPALVSLRKHNFLYLNLRHLLFNSISSPGNMDRYWPLLKAALR